MSKEHRMSLVDRAALRGYCALCGYTRVSYLPAKDTFVCQRGKALTNRLYKYGLKAHQYWALWKFNKGACHICNLRFDPDRSDAVDHNHACCSGKRSCGKCVRGLLCSDCNLKLGRLEDAWARYGLTRETVPEDEAPLWDYAQRTIIWT